MACTYICTIANYTHYYNDYKIFYSNTIFYMLTWGYNAAKNKHQNKTKQITNKGISQP